MVQSSKSKLAHNVRADQAVSKSPYQLLISRNSANGITIAMLAKWFEKSHPSALRLPS